MLYYSSVGIPCLFYCFLGTLCAAETFCSFLQIGASTQSCLGALPAVLSSLRFGFRSDLHYYKDRGVSFKLCQINCIYQR
ncbi:hypothetical protein GDO78_019962 [Eleutherodactylus coqui]|uniref:Uncharacterized protein n=1 Tax=Eleutherodactylus coqui TaxID=57060 RepID=A0A8J6JZH5_ELECQ|nr:hypothetical protein GDO78_019962 [Eleutherodactylus coqui]